MTKEKTRYDAVVIGAGHNGLTTAALLAKKGRKVLVVERRDSIGGLATSEEFYKGYRAPAILHGTTSVRARVVRKLNLRKFGLEMDETPPPVFSPHTKNRGLLLHHDPEKAYDEIARFSKRDAERYADYRKFIGKVRRFINSVFDDTPPDLANGGRMDLWRMVMKGVAFRRLGRKTMMELFRIGPMSVADWLDEWFETDLLKALLAGPAIYGSFTGPRSPGSAFNLLLWECSQGPAVKGGATVLVRALEEAARELGVTILKGVPVSRINVSEGRSFGVTLENSQEIPARVVAASCDPKTTFLDLVESREISELFEHRMRHFRSFGTTAKVNVALSSRVELADRKGELVEFIRIGESLNDLERAFDAAKYGRISERPVLDIYVPTLHHKDFAPKGHAVFSVLFHFAPYELREGWNQAERNSLAEKVIDTLSRYVRGIEDSIEACRVLSPQDIEASFGTTQGHIYHGEHAIDQMLVRPSPECSQYKTPISGLYLCGSGSHPGGGLTCAPGELAARTILAST